MAKRAAKLQPDTDAQIKAIRAKLASGRSMSALKDAKSLAKQQPGEPTSTLLADAYAARIDDLTSAGMLAEAREVVAVASARFPDRVARWQERATAVARQGGNLDDLLLAYRDAPDANARATISGELARNLKDPAIIARSEVFAADDPLRRGAVAVTQAFAAAANGELGEADRAALKIIPRRSPLSSWRSFTLALDAYHRHDSATCRRLLARIDDESAAARGKRILGPLLDGVPVAAGDRATARLVAKLSDGMHTIRTTAATLAMGADSAKERDAAALDLLVRLGSRSSRLAARMFLWLERQPAFRHAKSRLAEGVGRKIFGDSEWIRLLGNLGHEDDPDEEALLWISWLMPTRKDLRPLSDIELAAVVARILEPLRQHYEDLEETIGAAALATIGNLPAVRASIQDLLDGPDEWLIAEFAGPLMVAWTELLAALRQRTQVQPEVAQPIDELVLHALALDPLGATVARHLSWVRRRERVRRDQLLDAWSAALPADPEPWVLRALDAEERGALRKALGNLERAEALAPIDERVRGARFRVLMAQLRKHAADGRRHLCEKDLALLEATPAAQTPDRRAYLQALRAALELTDAADLIATVGAHRAAAVLALAQVDLRSNRGREFRGPHELEIPAGNDLRDDLATTAWLRLVRERVGAVPDIRLPSGAAQARDEDLPDDHGLLLSLCDCARHQDAPFLARVAHRGLQVDGPHLSRFLLARGESMARIGNRQRSIRCGELAHHFGVRAGDFEVVRATQHLRELDDEDAARGLAAERANPALPETTRPRQTKRQARRKPRIDTSPRLPFPSTDAAESES